VELFTLRGAAGIEVSIASYGATVQRVLAPDRDGQLADVVLGHATLEEYLAGPPTYFGAIVGRYANRIARGSFELDGRTFSLPANDRGHTLHGGPDGFDASVWTPVSFGDDELVLRLVSPDGDMGFPGAVTVTAAYRLEGGGSIRLDLRATSDAPTVLNLTNHGYWNLAGEGSGTVDRHIVSIEAGRYVAVDADLIPTGELAPVAGTALDFRTPVPLGGARAVDLNFVLDDPSGSLVPAADLYDPESGRGLTVLTTEPGLQLYTGENLDDGGAGKGGARYRARHGVSLEAQHFPDSPNHPGFPSTVLRPGETYSSTTVWRLYAR